MYTTRIFFHVFLSFQRSPCKIDRERNSKPENPSNDCLLVLWDVVQLRNRTTVLQLLQTLKPNEKNV